MPLALKIVYDFYMDDFWAGQRKKCSKIVLALAPIDNLVEKTLANIPFYNSQL